MKRNIMLGRLATLNLSPDAAEGVDPLDTNVNDIDTSRPVLLAKVYSMRVKKAVKEPTKDNTGERLTIQLETVDSATSTKGEPVSPGYVVTHYIGLTPKEPSGPGKRGYTMADVAKGIAEVGKWAGKNATPRSIMENPAQLDGAIGDVKVNVQAESAEWPESNRIGSFVIKK